MIDSKLLVDESLAVAARLGTRRTDRAAVDAARVAVVHQRQVRAELDELRARANRLSKELPDLAKRNDPGLPALREELRALKTEIAAGAEAERQANADAAGLVAALPNIPDPRTPVGSSEEENRILRVHADGIGPDSDPRPPHWETAERLRLADPARAAKLSGAGFTLMRGDGARLLYALASLGIDLHRDRYEEIRVPHLVREEMLFGTGHLPRFRDGVYRTEADDLWAVPTAEVPLAGLNQDEIIDPGQLPLRYVTQLSCFRREAGASGAETRGIQRLHEYQQVELMRIVHPDTLDSEFEILLSDAEVSLRCLDLCYRVVELCTGDLPFAATRAYRLDVYSPGMRRWLGVSTVSCFGDYQARRSKIRTRIDGRTQFVGTLNGSALAVSRLWGILLETGYQGDGTVRLPAALHGYMGKAVLTGN